MFRAQNTTRAAAGIIGLLLLSACATTGQEERINAFRDFIEVSELPEVPFINVRRELKSENFNDRYVIVTVRDEHHLIEYTQRCQEDPMTGTVRPDVRRDASRIYRTDTFRGCAIKKIYRISAEQADELRELGEAPGQRN